MSSTVVVITGLGLEFPGIADAAALLDARSAPVEPTEFNPADKLGRKGLRYKDRATKLALCAAQTALLDAGLPAAAEQVSPESFGTVVSSNLGNVDTVCRVLDTVRAEGADSTSPLDIPNLSSNVIASSLAIRFGLKAINLMVCNGATSGTDALHLAANAIRAGRARRVLVAAVEPANPTVTRLMEESDESCHESHGGLRLGDGAGALVLESGEAAAERGARGYAVLGGYGYDGTGDAARSLREALKGIDSLPGLWLVPNCAQFPAAAAVGRGLEVWGERPPERVDLSAALGETYGALGVFQCIAACLWLRALPGRLAAATTGSCWGDGCSSVVLYDATADSTPRTDSEEGDGR
jgi:3-oxoacyl-[acyl-carrier-protein] synthase II